MNGATAHSAVSRVSQLAALARVHAAFQWFHRQERQVMQWQHDLVSIAAPPFGEQQRAEWLRERFRELKLEQVEIDREGNVLGWRRARTAAPEPCTVLSAHIDTVFPRDVPVTPTLDHHRLAAPGACDNGAGIAGMLALAAALEHAGIEVPGDLLFVGNVGEEGEGDLRGMRHLYHTAPWRGGIAANLVLDGAGSDVAVTQALGSRRFLVTLEGPGGHSWTDAGIPNPIAVLCQAITSLGRLPLPRSPRTTLNVGTIAGGSAINSIPEHAAARFDLRSLDAHQLVRLEVALHRAIEDAVLEANRLWHGRPDSARTAFPLRFEIKGIGNRPAGRLSEDAPLRKILRAVDRHMGIRTQERAASTDANIPLSLGVPAISIGAGGEGGGIHTRAEWYDAAGRELALKRILLLLLALY